MSQAQFVRKLTSAELKELTRLVRSSDDGRVTRRAQMIRLSSQGQTTLQIARLWGMTSEVVRRLIHRFNTEGLAALADRPRRGRPPRANQRYVVLLKELVQTTPRDLGYPFTSWTLERLREHLARKTRIILNATYLSRLMAKNGIVYRRPKHSMAHLRDPQEYDEKKAFLAFVKKGRLAPRLDSTCSTSMSVRFISTRP